ncbi:MAG: penicillin-binding protein 2 [Chloroflexi bacterium]|nr:penicillin-binding protein 2 [Chloroflexota bacterium]
MAPTCPDGLGRQDMDEGISRDVTVYRERVSQTRRITQLLLTLAGALLVLCVRLAYWQLPAHPELDPYRHTQSPESIQPVRGGIVDATGYYLATTSYACRVSCVPSLLGDVDRDALAAQLAEITGLSITRVQAVVNSDEERAVDLVTAAPIEVAAQIDELAKAHGYTWEKGNSLALRAVRQYQRVYPNGELAAHVLGYVDLYDGKGMYGLEQRYLGLLTGREGEMQGVRNPWGYTYRATLGGSTPVQDGPDLRLTLDRNVQYAAERILAQAMLEIGAESGNLLVMEPSTGAVLAMAKRPTYNPSTYWQGVPVAWFNNDLVSMPYEPGSVIKAMTVAAALQEGAIQPNSVYLDEGSIEIGGRPIYNADGQAYGRRSITEMLAYSLNVGAANVAANLGPTSFYQTMRAFGFGEATGIDLAAEAAGVLRVPSQADWSMADFGRNAFGQGFSATPIQVATAFAALANDGMRMRPYLVAEIRGAYRTEMIQPQPVKQVVSPLVAQQTTELLADATELGMREALVDGYRIAGKSGTSSIAMGDAGYENDEVITSYVGYGPLPEPRWVILVKFDKPKVKKWGLESAAPEFRRMFEFLVSYYGVEAGGAPDLAPVAPVIAATATPVPEAAE